MFTEIQKSPVNAYSIQVAVPENFPGVLRVMRENFYHDEPMFRSYCRNYEITEQLKNAIDVFFDFSIKTAFEMSPCIVAVDKKTNKIVGANVTVLTQNPKVDAGVDKKCGVAAIFASDTPLPSMLQKFVDYLTEIDEKAELFEKFPNARAFWEFYAIAVDKEHRRLGLSTDLINAGMALAKNNDVPLVSAVFTSIYSKRSGEMCGMKTVMEVDFSEYKDDDGKQVFQISEPHNILSVMVKEI